MLAQTYVYEHPGPEEEGAVEAHAIIVMKRGLGFLAALPPGILTDEELFEGASAPMEALVGPSTVVEVAASLLTDTGLLPQPGATLTCVLVDFAAEAAPRFSVLGRGADPEILLSFDSGSPDLLPGVAAAGFGLGPAHRDPSGACCLLLS